MVYTVYIDVVFAVNTMMDVVVLAILNRVLSYRTTRRRILAGAAIGGAWSCVVSAVPSLPAAVEVLGTYVAVSSLMAAAAYHLRSFKDIVRSVAGIYLVSVVLGGVMLVIYEHTMAGYYISRLMMAGQGGPVPPAVWILMAAGGIAACCGFSGGVREYIRSMAGRKDLCSVIMTYGEREERVTGIIDTGNRLREPVTGRPVHVAGDGVMRRLCPAVKGVVYVPYRSVGTSRGILPAIYIDRMVIEQEGKAYCLEKPLIAITKQDLSPSGEYQILIQKSDEGTLTLEQHTTYRRTFP